MKTLVINTGSSSLKFQLFEVEPGSNAARSLARGKIESIGKEASSKFIINGKTPVSEKRPVEDHGQAVKRTLDWLKEEKCDFNAVGHRIVHGGDRFVRPARIDQGVVQAIEDLSELAPLHNRLGLAGIRACREALGDKIPMVAVFDTAFHSTMPPVAFRYAIPDDLAVRHKIRRYGFHGIAHGHLVSRYCQIEKKDAKDARLITVHLGQGCSVTAVRAGKSVDTSMGFTPLEGLVMGTRSGDIDPAVVSYLAEKENTDASKVVEWLNKRSGLAGLSGKTDDMRELLNMEAQDPRARLAVEIFCYRVKKYIGSYLSVLSGADAVVFSGGIGENQAEIRERICRGMEWCGLALDPALNRSSNAKESRISAEAAPCHAYVIPADEESVIAKETHLCLHPQS